MQKTLKELAELVGGRVLGDGAVALRGINGIDEAGPGEITFVANPRYAAKLATTRASAVVIGDANLAPRIPAIVAADPSLAFSRIASAFVDPSVRLLRGVHPSAAIGTGVSLGKDAGIGPNCVVEDGAAIGDGSVLQAQVYVGRGARIGRDCLLYPQVAIREACELGDRVVLHCGVVVGTDGFGYVTVQGVHHKIPQTGVVAIEDDVEIGANTCIDRARFGRTVVKKGTKIDNLVQVAHNVQIGEHCLIAAQVGISGSSKFDHHVVVGGQAGFGGHIEVGAGTIVSGQAGVAKSVPPGRIVTGTPARPRHEHFRALAAMERLPEILKDLERRIAELESRLKSAQHGRSGQR